MAERFSAIDKASLEYQHVPGSEIEYPYLSFLAQVRFAQTTARIFDVPLRRVLGSSTALFAYINGYESRDDSGVFNELVNETQETDNPTLIANTLFKGYLLLGHSEYRPPTPSSGNYFGGPSYEYKPLSKTVIRHFTPPDRTSPSPLSSAMLPVQEDNMRRMYTAIQERHPEARYVEGGTWLMSHPRYQSLLPDEAISSAYRLLPPDLDLTNDGVWGQFIGEGGRGHVKNYNTFVARLAGAKEPLDPILALPYPPLYSKIPIEHYYRRYGIKQ